MENLYTVSKIFSDRIFRVPDYQRGYAWEEQQCGDFVEDLELLGPGTDHFMGLLILHARTGRGEQVLDRRGKAYDEYDVIDGQQRLTTLVLFLDALHDEMESFESLRTMAEGIQETYIELRDLNDQRRPKLRLNRDTHAFFCGSVLARSVEPPRIRSHELLLVARDYFAAYLARKRQEMRAGYADWLKAEFLKVAQHLTLVVYTVHSEADAGVVFETMNNRGKDLTELEKTKNYLLYLASKLELPAAHDLAETINDAWAHLFERLMATGLGAIDDEDRLLRAHWLMAYDHNPKNWAGSRSIKARFNLRRYQGHHEALLADLKAYLASLNSAVIAYCDVFAPRHTNAFGAYRGDAALHNQVVAAAEKMARLDASAPFLPLLMAARLRSPNDGQPYLEALKICERFAFRVYRWLERPTNTGQSWLFRLGHDLYAGRNLLGIFNEMRGAILYYCPDGRFLDRFAQEDQNWYRWPGIQYLLYEYEEHLAGGQPVRMAWEVAARKHESIEHILPQSLDAGGYWASRFTADEHRRWLHDIGNLTLTFDNSALGNKPFPQKKGAAGQPRCYAGSKLFVEQAIARCDDWTPAAVQARREEIAAWARERWQVDPVTIPSPDGHEGDQDLIRRILTRRFLPLGQMLLFQALYQAGNEGVPYQDLVERIDMTPHQMAGVLGALGHRVNRTEGAGASQAGISLLLRWDQVNGVLVYFVRPELRAAVEALPRLHDVIANWSPAEIRDRYVAVWDGNEAIQRQDLGFDGMEQV